MASFEQRGPRLKMLVVVTNHPRTKFVQEVAYASVKSSKANGALLIDN